MADNQFIPGWDYNLEADKVERRKKIAQLLEAQALQQPGRGQTVSNGYATVYLPGQGEGIAGGLSKLGQAVMARRANKKADAAGEELSAKSKQAMDYVLSKEDGYNSLVANALKNSSAGQQPVQGGQPQPTPTQPQGYVPPQAQQPQQVPPQGVPPQKMTPQLALGATHQSGPAQLPVPPAAAGQPMPQQDPLALDPNSALYKATVARMSAKNPAPQKPQVPSAQPDVTKPLPQSTSNVSPEEFQQLGMDTQPQEKPVESISSRPAAVAARALSAPDLLKRGENQKYTPSSPEAEATNARQQLKKIYLEAQNYGPQAAAYAKDQMKSMTDGKGNFIEVNKDSQLFNPTTGKWITPPQPAGGKGTGKFGVDEKGNQIEYMSDGSARVVKSETGDAIRDPKAVEDFQKRDAQFADTMAGMERTKTRLNNILHPAKDQPSIKDGTGITGSIAAAMPWGTDASKIRGRVKDVMAATVLDTITQMGQSGLAVSQLFNTQMESQRLQDMQGSIDWLRMSDGEIENKVTEIQTAIKDAQERMRRAYEAEKSARGRQEQQTTVPGRGQTASAAQYGF